MHLRTFRQKHLDYIEGLRDTPPSLNTLTDADRLAASRWIKSMDAARGIDPRAQRPSTAELMKRWCT